MSDSWFSTQRWIKARNFRNSNNELAHAYPLTPCGIEQKAAITVRFLRHKVAEYETLEKEIRALRFEMDALSECRLRCSEG